ncbi:MAG: methylmalonyl Co-A mutase-associated GTPase MeaB [Thermoplasmatota archaeon]
MNLEEDVAAGKRRAIGRLISGIEDNDPEAHEVLRRLHGKTGGAHVIGITGSPGTGKSTLTDQLIDHYRRAGLKVGVIAVDPSSPFSGGAILGDRIRMQSRSTDPDVFIRSMGTRGALGGLSSSCSDAVKVLEAAGKDVILVETVGVGQAEVDVIRLADTVIVVLVPGLGDDVQAVKAGVMEIADVFVVNKADIDGSDKVYAEVEASMMLGHPDTDVFWWAPILRTVAQRGEGIDKLAQALDEHKAWSQEHGFWQARRAKRLRRQVKDLLHRNIEEFAFRGEDPKEAFAAWFEQAQEGQLAPLDVAEKILAAYRD